jgi:hypothetical protein
MQNITAEILKEVNALKAHLATISEEEAKKKPAPGKWSKQEITGHMTDSAFNNIQRVVRGRYNKANAFPPYEQDEWVEAQNYNSAPWQEVIDMFVLNNYQFCRAANNLPKEALSAECSMGANHGTVTLEYVITDYLRHLKHHAAQLLK